MAKAAPELVTRLTVRLTPNGGRDAVDGWEQGADGTLLPKARVTAHLNAQRPTGC